jgi:hypothetical protein
LSPLRRDCGKLSNKTMKTVVG